MQQAGGRCYRIAGRSFSDEFGMRAHYAVTAIVHDLRQ
jgi:hypothetical protein